MTVFFLKKKTSAKQMKKKGEMEEKWGHDSKLWNEFVKSIKLGIIEEATDRNRLAKLLSFERFV